MSRAVWTWLLIARMVFLCTALPRPRFWDRSSLLNGFTTCLVIFSRQTRTFCRAFSQTRAPRTNCRGRQKLPNARVIFIGHFWKLFALSFVSLLVGRRLGICFPPFMATLLSPLSRWSRWNYRVIIWLLLSPAISLWRHLLPFFLPDLAVVCYVSQMAKLTCSFAANCG